MSRRVRISMKDLRELEESRDWSRRKGFEGLAVFYDQLLQDHAKRRALPKEAYAEMEPEPERDDRSRREDRGR